MISRTSSSSQQLTSNDVLEFLKIVDGEGSGLDTDLIRGLPGDFTNSLASSGYQKLPSGLIIQWGTATQNGSVGYAEVTFPIAFPNALLSVAAIHIGTGNVAVIEYDGHTTQSSMRFRILNPKHYADNWLFRWIAIGY